MNNRTLLHRRPRAEVLATPLARELSDEAVIHQARALADYIQRPDGRGGSAWLDGRDFLPGDRAAVLLAAADLLDEGGTAAA